MRTHIGLGSLVRAAAVAVATSALSCGSSTSSLSQDCVGAPLPLQNARSFTLGETFYLPRLSSDACPSNAAWEVSAAPAGSSNRVYMTGAPEPRFTPDVPGQYQFRVIGGDATFDLQVVARPPRERFRNHYLPALYGAARVADEVWTANGATYSVSRVRRGDDGRWQPAQEIPVAAWPGAVAWRDPLAFVLVAHRGADTVGFVSRERGVLEDALWVGDEPTALTLSPDGAKLYVALPTMRQIAVVDTAQRAVVARVAVGADPRALALSADGQKLYVASYRAGNREKDLKGTYGPGDGDSLWVVDTSSLTVVDTVGTLAALHRGISLSEDGTELYVAASDGDPIPSQGDLTAKPFVHEAIVLGVDGTGVADGAPLRRTDLTRQEGSGGPAVGPASIMAQGDKLWVSAESSGIVVALDRATLAERGRVTVGAAARQLLALDDGTVVVHCTGSNELWFLRSLDAPPEVVQVVREDGRPAPIAIGEDVFNRPGSAFGVNHGCASCHTEAENDGMVWRFGTNLWDNVRPLQLLSATTPVGWAAYVSNTQVFSYSGPASIIRRPVSPEEAEGMDRFLSSLIGAPRATGRTRLDGSYTEAALRGKAIFEGKAVCSSCHKAPLYTNREMVPLGKSGQPADVPTLLGVYRHAAFFVKAGARTLETAVDVAVNYVGVTLTDAEKADLVEFLYQLTPKEGAPLGIWPDIDNAEGVEPSVNPWVEFADPVDGTSGLAAAEAAKPYLKLEKLEGGEVPGRVEVDGWRVRFVPTEPLTPGAGYVFRVLAGLPFQSGGALTAERRTRFQVAATPMGAWPENAQITVMLTGPGGMATAMPIALQKAPAADPADPTTVVMVPGIFATQQRQTAWVRLDGDKVTMAPFAIPVSPTAVGNAGDVVGKVTSVEGGIVRRIEGTLRLSGPSINTPGIPFTIDAM
jgi:YVTN family beta-propeller protein